MKITTLILGLILLPNVSSAAALTNDQASSLIAVVQSSPTTPASAFVPLITTFSNITVTQAESLIRVVQQAPGVPANSFVSLLIAFTVDPTVMKSVTQSTPTVEPVNNVNLGSQPVVQSLPVKNITTNINPFVRESGDRFYDIFVYYSENGKGVEGAPITIAAPEGYFHSDGKRFEGSATQTTRYSSGLGASGGFGVYFQYMIDTPGAKELTLTSGEYSKTVTVE